MKATDKNIWRIELRDGKKFKVKWWDNLSYEQVKIIRENLVLFGVFHIKKNPLKWKKKVIENKLSDYVWGIEIKEVKKNE